MDGIRVLVSESYRGVGLNPASEFLGNTLLDYTLSFIVFSLAYGACKLIQRVILVKLEALAQKSPTDLDDVAIKMVRSFRPPFYAFLAFWFSFQFLSVHGWLAQILTAIVIIWVIYQTVIAAGIFIEEIVLKKVAKDKSANTQSALKILAHIAKGALWGVGVIMLLSNLGVDVTGLVAGLGIGGIAIAFALQGILSDLFSSFSIYFDKPFEVGDFITVGTEMGTVEHIGIKSTRLRALSGEEIVMSNHYLTGAQIHNFKKMKERRAMFRLGVTYDTPREKLERGLAIIKQAVDERENARLDRAHFSSFGDFALQYECVYYVTVPDYVAYMDSQQAINFQIIDGFRDEGIEMAFPTQTVHLREEKQQKRAS